MKRITFRVNTLINGLLAGALGLLGFASCGEDEDTPCMYGTPTGVYQIKGTVTDETDKPVDNATVIMRRIRDKEVLASLTTAITKANGEYSFRISDFPMEKIRLVCRPQSSGLEADSVDIEVHFDGKGDGPWMVGTARETVNFKLKFSK